MTKKIFRSVFLGSMTVLIASLVVVLGVLYGYFSQVQEDELRTTMELAVNGVEQMGQEYLETLNSDDFRFTLVAADGNVLYDTQSDAQTMENHADREEIREALVSGRGSSSRYSSTLTEQTIYYAQRLSDGNVLRISVDQATVLMLVIGMLQPTAFVIILAVVLSLILSRRMAKRVVMPLNELDFDHPLENDAYEELSPLLTRINRQHRQIDAQLKELQRKSDEFEQITRYMSEGLVLINDKNVVVSVNRAAMEIFHTDASCIGQDFLTIERSTDMSHAIQGALTDGHMEIRAERDGKEYQFDISRIESDGSVIGAVILAFDITEQAFAERNRREFTANVSHELKTPLQSIIGSAELIENGLVKQEDMPRFMANIHTEAVRLVALIDDIIRLSQLDEGDELPYESVDLLSVAKEVAASLHDAAAAGKVKLTVTGESVTIKAVRRLVSEIVFNLCDNAIKYNVQNGSVDVSVTSDGKDAVLTVRDTGIGIPVEHQSRVFERFYRVDKSHSKESGGTGLGLSIVKHAAAYHNAKIDMVSKVGQGTTVTVTFPIGDPE